MALVRNFWLHASVDNKVLPFATGPKKDDGGMRITLSTRNKGRSETALTIQCNAWPEGRLEILVFDSRGSLVHKHETER